MELEVVELMILLRVECRILKWESIGRCYFYRNAMGLRFEEDIFYFVCLWDTHVW